MKKKELKQVLLTIDNAKEEQDLYSYLLENSNLGEHTLTTMFHHHMIGLNNRSAKKADVIQNGDILDYKIPDWRPPVDLPENIPLEILYEDDDIIVVNKPKGLACQPGPSNWKHTLTNALLYYKQEHQLNYLTSVHRLDQFSSGCLLLAKNKKSAKILSQQLSEKICHRTYVTLVEGRMESGTIIDSPIGRDPDNFRIMKANGTDAKEAYTSVRVLEKFDAYTFIECELGTGRTHQIRVHLRSIGHPLVGDEIYGKACTLLDTEGQVLHASKITFIQPMTNEKITVEAPLPKYFCDLLNLLRN